MNRNVAFAAVGLLVIIGGILIAVFSGGKSPSPDNSNLTWQSGDSFRAAPLTIATSGRVGFEKLPAEATGITFTNTLSEDLQVLNRNLFIGSGVALGDIDGDGLCDIFFCGMEKTNAVYHNLGNWKFEDITESAGVALPGIYCTGAALVDIDGDSDLDLVVATLGVPDKSVPATETAGAVNRLFLNDGKGTFTDASDASGIADEKRGSTSLAFADIDGDGDLDMYVCNYRPDTIRDNPNPDLSLDNVNGELRVPEKHKDRFTLVDGALRELGEVDALYVNDGKGKFTRADIAKVFRYADGQPVAPRDLGDWGLAVGFCDVNGDLAPDIYVANDYASPDRFWLNRGDGTFEEAPRVAMRNMASSAMSVAFGDVDRDGHVDFFVTDMLSRSHALRKKQMGAMKPTPIEIGLIENQPQFMRNVLQINRGDNTWAEMAPMAAVDKSEWSWTSLFLDVDFDGDEDLLVTTGHAHDVQDTDTSNRLKAVPATDAARRRRMLLEFPRLDTPNIAFRNDGHLHFAEVGKDWGFDNPGVSHGMAMADLDNDGDLDLVINDFDRPATILKNLADAPRVAVRLKGRAPNTQGIGARVRLLGGPGGPQERQVIGAGLYLSSADTLQSFAAGTDANAKLSLEIIWRNGKVQRVDGVKPNHIYEITENDPATLADRPAAPAPPAPLFEDVTPLLGGHTHHEDPFDDFVLQELLPNRFSQQGPGITWFDFDGDGDDDLIVGSGAGGKLGVLRNDNGKFVAITTATGNTDRDHTSVLGFHNASGVRQVMAGLMNWESGVQQGKQAAAQLLVGAETWDGVGGVAEFDSATGPLAMADIDGDGDLDMFLGGRVVHARYPEIPDSHLFVQTDNTFAATQKFEKLGLVSAATFSDIDGDGDADLVLALEWGPITILANDGKGRFTDVTKAYGLADRKGWWNGVATGDFDGDGRMDIVATNWGDNSKYHLHPDHPLTVYGGDLNGDGEYDVIEAHFDKGMNCIVPERGLSCSSRAMPFVKEVTPTYTDFGKASLIDIYGDRLDGRLKLTCNTLTHTLFLNRGETFEAVELPLWSQIAPSFAVVVADFNGDGNDDVFLAQNYFAAQIETYRTDAGRGLLLVGDGKGGLEPLRGQFSGIKVYGDQRGAAAADFDGDGRVDVAISQNGAATRLFRNATTTPGLRVRLAGAAGNPTAVGAKIRAMHGETLGAAREIQCGSGYWSQNSAVQVIGNRAAITGIHVRWPNGTETKSDVPADANDITIGMDGNVTVNR